MMLHRLLIVAVALGIWACSAKQPIEDVYETAFHCLESKNIENGLYFLNQRVAAVDSAMECSEYATTLASYVPSSSQNSAELSERHSFLRYSETSAGDYQRKHKTDFQMNMTAYLQCLDEQSLGMSLESYYESIWVTNKAQVYEAVAACELHMKSFLHTKSYGSYDQERKKGLIRYSEKYLESLLRSRQFKMAFLKFK